MKSYFYIPTMLSVLLFALSLYDMEYPKHWELSLDHKFDSSVKFLDITPNITCLDDYKLYTSILNQPYTFEKSKFPKSFTIPCQPDWDTGKCDAKGYVSVTCVYSCDLYCASPVKVNSTHSWMCKRDQCILEDMERPMNLAEKYAYSFLFVIGFICIGFGLRVEKAPSRSEYRRRDGPRTPRVATSS